MICKWCVRVFQFPHLRNGNSDDQRRASVLWMSQVAIVSSGLLKMRLKLIIVVMMIKQGDWLESFIAFASAVCVIRNSTHLLVSRFQRSRIGSAMVEMGCSLPSSSFNEEGAVLFFKLAELQRREAPYLFHLSFLSRAYFMCCWKRFSFSESSFSNTWLLLLVFGAERNFPFWSHFLWTWKCS